MSDAIKPVAWIDTMTLLDLRDFVFPRGATLQPIYDQSAIDAAVAKAQADERERCAKLCEEVEDQAWALWKAIADPIEQGRNIGAQHCADAIRQPVDNQGQT